MHLKTEVALAGWMAGELLGDDWNLSESLPVLTSVVKGAPNVVGRVNALHGLSQALRRTRGHARHYIITILRQVALNDKSKKIRDSAKELLKQILRRGTARTRSSRR